MKKLSQQAIKIDGIRRIFDFIAHQDSVSRSSIADHTGLSLMTVGKAADVLLEQELILQMKSPQNHAGRRTGFLKTNENKYIVIINLAVSPYAVSVYNLRLQLINHYLCPSFPLFGLSFFSSLSELILSDFEMEDCLAFGVIFSSTSAKDSLSIPADVEDIISNYFGDIPFFQCSNVNSAAIGIAYELDSSEDRSILYWHSSVDDNQGAYVINGELLHGFDTKSCDFGKLSDSSGLCFNERIKEGSRMDELEEVFAQEIANILRILPLHHLVISHENPSPLSSDVLCQILSQKHGFTFDSLPEISVVNHSKNHAEKGLALIIRDQLLARIADKQ